MINFKDPNVCGIHGAVSATIIARAQNNDLIDTVVKGGRQVVIDETCPGDA